MVDLSTNQLVQAVRNGGYIVHHGEGLFSAYCHAAGTYTRQCSLDTALEHMRRGLGRTTGTVDTWDAIADTWHDMDIRV